MERRTLGGMTAFIRRVCAQLAATATDEPGADGISVAPPSQPPGTADDAAGSPASQPAQPELEAAAPVEGQETPAYEAEWDEAEQGLASGAVQEATVVGWNRGGLLVQWNNLQGFLPASQLQHMIRYTTDAERDTAFAGRVGEAMRLKVIEVDRLRRRLVFSERALQWEGDNGQSLWESLQPGQVRRGRVRNLCDFGAFIDLGGIDGLIHISELAWSHVRHPADKLEIGQDVDVYVMSVEPSRKRVALSLKKLARDPWESIEERYEVGQMVEGVVTNVLSFGAFACIEDGVEGLIHISELAEGSFLHPRNVVTEGDTVGVRIIGIDAASRRLALSMRQAHSADASQTREGPTPAGE